MADLIDRYALIAEYDRVHVGAPGGARKLMQDAPAVNRWIPCSERLPESNIYVLCAMRTGEFCIMEYDEEDQEWYEEIHDYRKHCVTHWMPLPEIPEPPEKE